MTVVHQDNYYLVHVYNLPLQIKIKVQRRMQRFRLVNFAMFRFTVSEMDGGRPSRGEDASMGATIRLAGQLHHSFPGTSGQKLLLG